MRLLPWEYGVRNLLRRPLRTALTVMGLTLALGLMFVVVGFIRGLEQTLAASGDPRVVYVHRLGTSENLELSSIAAGVPALLAANIDGIQRRRGQAFVSPEVYLATLVGLGQENADLSQGLLRGVTPAALLVHATVQITEGRWPEAGEVLVGRLAATKLGVNDAALAGGATLFMEGRTWTVAGRFDAPGSTLESEIWCPLGDLQVALQRQDLTLVAVKLASEDAFAELDEFCSLRLDLELEATREADYYAGLEHNYGTVRRLAWLMVAMIAVAGTFAALNTMYAAVAGRTRELAVLQTIGFPRRAVLAGLVQESMLLAATATLLAAALGMAFIHNTAVRFTMGAFVLRVDGAAMLAGCGLGLLLGLIGALPPAVRALRIPVAEALKAA